MPGFLEKMKIYKNAALADTLMLQRQGRSGVNLMEEHLSLQYTDLYKLKLTELNLDELYPSLSVGLSWQAMRSLIRKELERAADDFYRKTELMIKQKDDRDISKHLATEEYRMAIDPLIAELLLNDPFLSSIKEFNWGISKASFKPATVSSHDKDQVCAEIKAVFQHHPLIKWFEFVITQSPQSMTYYIDNCKAILGTEILHADNNLGFLGSKKNYTALFEYVLMLLNVFLSGASSDSVISAAEMKFYQCLVNERGLCRVLSDAILLADIGLVASLLKAAPQLIREQSGAKVPMPIVGDAEAKAEAKPAEAKAEDNHDDWSETTSLSAAQAQAPAPEAKLKPKSSVSFPPEAMLFSSAPSRSFTFPEAVNLPLVAKFVLAAWANPVEMFDYSYQLSKKSSYEPSKFYRISFDKAKESCWSWLPKDSRVQITRDLLKEKCGVEVLEYVRIKIFITYLSVFPLVRVKDIIWMIRHRLELQEVPNVNSVMEWVYTQFPEQVAILKVESEAARVDNVFDKLSNELLQAKKQEEKKQAEEAKVRVIEEVSEKMVAKALAKAEEARVDEVIDEQSKELLENKSKVEGVLEIIAAEEAKVVKATSSSPGPSPSAQGKAPVVLAGNQVSVPTGPSPSSSSSSSSSPSPSTQGKGQVKEVANSKQDKRIEDALTFCWANSGKVVLAENQVSVSTSPSPSPSSSSSSSSSIEPAPQTLTRSGWAMFLALLSAIVENICSCFGSKSKGQDEDESTSLLTGNNQQGNDKPASPLSQHNAVLLTGMR